MWSSEYVWPLCTSGKGTTWEMPIWHEANPTNHPKDTNVEFLLQSTSILTILIITYQTRWHHKIKNKANSSNNAYSEHMLHPWQYPKIFVLCQPYIRKCVTGIIIQTFGFWSQWHIWILTVVSILWILVLVTHLDCGTHVLWFVSVLTVWILSPSRSALSVYVNYAVCSYKVA